MASVMTQMKAQVKQVMPEALRHRFNPLRFQAFCVGTPKSGTTSFAGMFEHGYRAEHESERVEIVHAMYEHFHGRISDEQYCQFLKQHQRRIWLELESSCFLGYRPDLVYKTFPNAKYVLTIRDPRSWLDSMLNNNINYPRETEPTFAQWHDVFFQPERFSYQLEDSCLKEHNLYPIDAYLQYWMDTNKAAIEAIPSSQLLVLETRAITKSIEQISKFLGIDPSTISVEKSHSHATKDKHDVLGKIDPTFLQSRINTICCQIDNYLDSSNQLFAK